VLERKAGLKVGIMQPYLFPYLGYFHLAESVDILVLRDVGQFTKGSWITRNRLEYSHGLDWFGIPTQKSRVDTEIREKLISPEWTPQQLRRKIEPALFDLPNRRAGLELVDASLNTVISANALNSLFEVLHKTLTCSFEYLGISCKVLNESTLKLANLPGIDGVLDICRNVSATQYINLPGGRSMYSRGVFERAGLELSFVEPDFTPYSRGGRNWQPGLSILDAVSASSQSELMARIKDDYALSPK
jgi:hypothetical protein